MAGGACFRRRQGAKGERALEPRRASANWPPAMVQYWPRLAAMRRAVSPSPSSRSQPSAAQVVQIRFDTGDVGHDAGCEPALRQRWPTRRNAWRGRSARRALPLRSWRTSASAYSRNRFQHPVARRAAALVQLHEVLAPPARRALQDVLSRPGARRRLPRLPTTTRRRRCPAAGTALALRAIAGRSSRRWRRAGCAGAPAIAGTAGQQRQATLQPLEQRRGGRPRPGPRPAPGRAAGRPAGGRSRRRSAAFSSVSVNRRARPGPARRRGSRLRSGQERGIVGDSDRAGRAEEPELPFAAEPQRLPAGGEDLRSGSHAARGRPRRRAPSTCSTLSRISSRRRPTSNEPSASARSTLPEVLKPTAWAIVGRTRAGSVRGGGRRRRRHRGMRRRRCLRSRSPTGFFRRRRNRSG